MEIQRGSIIITPYFVFVVIFSDSDITCIDCFSLDTGEMVKQSKIKTKVIISDFDTEGGMFLAGKIRGS